MIETLPIDQLVAGMWVAALDRPWSETPLGGEGFFIESDADIVRLREHCRCVIVDWGKSRVKMSDRAPAKAPPRAPQRPGPAPSGHFQQLPDNSSDRRMLTGAPKVTEK